MGTEMQKKAQKAAEEAAKSKLNLRKAAFKRQGFTMDDSDVKKLFSKKRQKRDDKFDEIGLISKMNEERGNGNIDKSKRLGSYLASIFLDKDVLLQKLRPIIGDKEYTKAESFQMKNSYVLCRRVSAQLAFAE